MGTILFYDTNRQRSPITIYYLWRLQAILSVIINQKGDLQLGDPFDYSPINAFKHSYMKYLHLPVIILFIFVQSSLSQTQPDSTQKQGTLRVFIDCRTHHCDFDYFRTEISYIDYVRDQGDADVHVLVTTQGTGGGGTEFTANFIGRHDYAGIETVFNTSSGQTDTDDEIRIRLVRVLKAGLMPYLSQTPQFEQIAILYTAQEEQQAGTQAEDDPWNYWVFRTNLNGHSDGDDRFQSLDLAPSIMASRTTEHWNILIAAEGSRRSQTFTYDDGTTEKDIQESYEFDGVVIKSLSDHWSTGAGIMAERSTRSNYDLVIEPVVAVEYNIFPYSESTRKQFMIRYIFGAAYNNYADSTIFNKIEETLGQQIIEMQVGVRQPWGDINTFFEASSYMHDLQKYSLELGGNVDVRIFRGLSFNFGGNISLVRDQLNIAKGNASNEDVLLRRRELETDWRYSTFFGIRYTFGSIYNNIVNTRFGF